MSEGVKPVVLVTSRLRLDQPKRSDVPTIAEICADSEVARWIPVMPQPYGLSDAMWFVEEFVPDGWATGKELTWMLRLPSGEVIGSVGVNVASKEIGYWLGKAHRGQGYMREAVAAVLEWWFAQGTDRVVWKCLRGNAPSVAVARAAGFRYQPLGPGDWLQSEDAPSRFWYAVLEAKDPRVPRSDWPPE